MKTLIRIKEDKYPHKTFKEEKIDIDTIKTVSEIEIRSKYYIQYYVDLKKESSWSKLLVWLGIYKKGYWSTLTGYSEYDHALKYFNFMVENNTLKTISKIIKEEEINI